MKEKKKTGEAGLMTLPAKRPLTEWEASELEYQRDKTISRQKLMKALSAFNRRYRSRQREEKE